MDIAFERVAAVLCGLAAFGYGIYTFKQPTAKILPNSPQALICHAHQTIRQLDSGEMVTLFTILKQDPSVYPFHPGDECSSPHGNNYKAARQAIADAWMEMTTAHVTLEWRNAYALAAATLLDDGSRQAYMNLMDKVSPGKKSPMKVWKEYCQVK